MKILRKISVCFVFSCFILLELVLAQGAMTQIKVEGADVVLDTQLTPSTDLQSIAKIVPSRVIVEYADSISGSVLIKSSEINALAKSVPDRMMVEYADSIFNSAFIIPKDANTLAKSVPDRLIVEYADSVLYRDCQRSQPLESLAKIVAPRIIVEYADACLSTKLINFFKGEFIPPVLPSTITSFKLALDKGLNMISLPVKPDTPLTARSFANNIGSTVVIKYDTKESKFLPFVPDVSQGDGFAIEGGRGYIVNVLNSKEVVFTGTAWSNVPSKLSPNKGSSHWAFVVCGTIFDGNSIAQNGNLSVAVKNLRTGKTIESEIGQIENGRYTVAFVDMSKRDVINSGDSLAIYLKDNAKIAKPVTQKITISDIDKSFVNVALNTKSFIPEKNLLLQNYPNPFNPDTWIPYQLKEDADVAIKIYTATGQLVRTLNLGRKPAGFYADKKRAAYWDGRNEVGEKAVSGIYFYMIQAGKFKATRKMVINE